MSESFDYDFMPKSNNNTEDSNKSNENSAIKLDLDIDLDIDLDQIPETVIKTQIENDRAQFLKSQMTLKERINDHLIETDKYWKISHKKSNEIIRITLDEFESNESIIGASIYLHEVENLSVVDIDVNHHENDLMDESDAEKLRNEIIGKCRSNDYVLVRSPRGGFHIYCNNDDSWIDKYDQARRKNAFTAISIKKGLDLDLFMSRNPNKCQNCLVAESKVVPEIKFGEIIQDNDPRIKQSEFINGSYDSIVNYSITDVLKTFNWKEAVENHLEKPKRTFNSDDDDDDDRYSEEIQLALINGLFGFEIHNCAHAGKSMEKEVALLHFCKAVNCLNENLIDLAYAKVHENDLLTDKAKEHFDEVYNKLIDEKSHMGCLFNIIKFHNPNYFKTNVLPLNGVIDISDFDLHDNFRLKNLINKATKHKYRTFEQAIKDISRVYRFKLEGDKYFIEKGIDPNTKTLKWNYVTFERAREQLKSIHLYPKTDTTFYTAWDAFIEYQHLLSFDDIAFNLDISEPELDVFGEPLNLISFFHGYRYQKLPECDMSEIENYLKLIYEVISDSDEEVYNYILNWIANIAQNPGKRNMTSIVMKGVQGAGKNTFTDILAQLFIGYSNGNINDLNAVVGNFNSAIEHKILIVLNEMKSSKDAYLQDMDALKSLITDPRVRIGEKFQPNRWPENVSNLIFISNHAKPIIVPSDDRRFLVVNVSGKYKYDNKLLKDLHNLPESFYNNLMTFFLNRDISKFDPTVIPLTGAKKNLIEACRSDVEQFIVENYNRFTVGITYSEWKQIYDVFVNFDADKKKLDRFKLKLKDVCISSKDGRLHRTSLPFSDGKKREVYKLKPEYLEIYKPDLEEEVDPQNYL